MFSEGPLAGALIFVFFCLDAAPAVPLALDRTALLANLRRARRGAAPGPSGYTAEILRLVLDEEDASQLFFEVASLLARAHVPESAVAGLALGRLVALSKLTRRGHARLGGW